MIWLLRVSQVGASEKANAIPCASLRATELIKVLLDCFAVARNDGVVDIAKHITLSQRAWFFYKLSIIEASHLF